MSENNVVELPLTPQDKADLAKLGVNEDEAPSYHTILEIWATLLRDGLSDPTARVVTPQFANRMVQTYPEVRYAGCADLLELYYAKVSQLADILAAEIESDDDCLSYSEAAEDATENAAHYKNLLLNWQLAVLQWELEWDCQHKDAAIEIAAISEVHKMFFSERGLIPHLETIQFEFTEADQAQLGAALEELRAAHLTKEAR